MSEAPQGPGWWLASDGRYYPPAPMPSPPAEYAPTPYPHAAAPVGYPPVQAGHPVGYPYPSQPPVFVPVPVPYGYGPVAYGYGPLKSKAAAALLAFFLGGTGAHNFYLGKTGLGVLQLCMLIFGVLTSWLGIGLIILAVQSVWVLIEFIVIIAGGIRDSQGRPLG